MTSNAHSPIAHDHHGHDDEGDLLGAAFARRHVLAGLGIVTAGLAVPAAAGAATRTAKRAAKTLGRVPQETTGPFPGDGSNGPDVLAMSGVVRRDMRSDIGSSTPGAGVPLTVKLTVLQSTRRLAPLVKGAVYAWHCDPQGRYSMYSPGTEQSTFCRAVQPTDGAGTATFLTLYPGAYPGRWPHIHFEVYGSVADAVAARSTLTTSQIAMPEAASRLVYATADYPGSAANLAAQPISRDMVFADGWSRQMGTVSGTVAKGMTVSLTIAI